MLENKEFTTIQDHKVNENNNNAELKKPLSGNSELLDPESLNLASSHTLLLSNGIEENLNESDISKFQNILKDMLPKEVYEYVTNLNEKDIAIIMAVIIGAAILIASGGAVTPIVTGLATRLGLSAVFRQAIIFALSREKTVSAVMGAIPGMKWAAPNQGIAHGISFLKDIVRSLAPGVPSIIDTINKK